MSEKKRERLTSEGRCLFLLFLSLCLTALVAAGLPRLVFRPGMPLPSLEGGSVVAPPARGGPAVGMGLGSLAGILGLIVLVVCMVVLLVRAARGIPWLRVLSGLWSLLWKLALVAGALILVMSLLPHSGAGAGAAPLPEPRHLATAPLGPVPVIVIWAAAVTLGAALVVLSVRLVAVRRRRDRPPWVLEAASARRALLDGSDLRDVIIRCYTRMSAALQEERGIEREESMTAGEFELLLAGKGMPRDPVHQLTRLFESARYSLREPDPEDKRAALACLESILEHSRHDLQSGEGA